MAYDSSSQQPEQENSDNATPSLAQRFRVLQIIRAAVIAGPLAFLPIALFFSNKPLNFEISILEIIAFLMLASCIAIFLLIGKLNPPKNIEMIRAGSLDEREGALASSVVSNEIIRGALLEAPTFFCFILIMINGSLIGLTLGTLLTVIALAVFPTGNRIRNQVEALKFKYGL